MTDQPSTQGYDKSKYTEIDVLPNGRKIYTNPATGRFIIERDPNLPPGWPPTIPIDWVYDAESDSYAPARSPTAEEDRLYFEKEREKFRQFMEEYRRNPPRKEIIKIDWVPQKSRKLQPSPERPSQRKTDSQLNLFGEDEAGSDEPPPSQAATDK